MGEKVRGGVGLMIRATSRAGNGHLMELLIMCDALKRASAASINAVIPYYGYARQDRKVAARTPITAKLVADLLGVAGAPRAGSMEMRAGAVQRIFYITTPHLSPPPRLLAD